MSDPASAGKAVLVAVAGSARESYFLTDAAPDEFMGMRCIKGTFRLPRRSSHWLGSRTMYIPLDKILFVSEYESYEAYLEAITRHDEEQSK